MECKLLREHEVDAEDFRTVLRVDAFVNDVFLQFSSLGRQR